MRSCFLDTCAVIDLLDRSEKVVSAAAGYDNVLISHVVFGELMFGCHCSRNPKAEVARVLAGLLRVSVVPATERTAEIYGLLAADLEKSGKRIPQNDIWIAALCVAFGFPLLTTDAHFSRVPKLKVINYQSPS